MFVEREYGYSDLGREFVHIIWNCYMYSWEMTKFRKYRRVNKSKKGRKNQLLKRLNENYQMKN